MATAGQHAQPGVNGNGAKAAPAGSTPPKDSKVVAERPIDKFRKMLDRMKGEISSALPPHMDRDRFYRVLCTAMQETPKLFECSPDSLFGRIVQCAQLGLEPDGLLGHAHLVPFFHGKRRRQECKLIIGYKGLIKLARNSGEVTDVVARVVYDKDYFDVEYGLNEKLVHRPYMAQDIEDENDHGGAVKAVYCIFRLKGGGNHFEVMSTRDVERIRRMSQYPDGDPWEVHWDEMAKKTCIRKTAKYSPASVEDRMARAISLDERAEAGLSQDVDGSGKYIDIEEVEKAAAPAAVGESEVIELSSLKQRKDVVVLAGQAKVQVADVLKWFPDKQAVDELTRQQADEAIAKLQAVIADEKGPIS